MLEPKGQPQCLPVKADSASGMQDCASPGHLSGSGQLKYPWEGPWEVSRAWLGYSYSTSYFHGHNREVGSASEFQFSSSVLQSQAPDFI